MRIANNVPALLTHTHMRRNDRSLTAAMNRLSTGFRINSARDDAAGMAISNKLTFQLVGLQRASDNSNHGVSLVQTAEGALNEVHSMLQRMRELSVYAASDTLTHHDRMSLQEEIYAITEEITALSQRTEFNTIGLLNGEAARVSTNWATIGGESILTRSITNTLLISEGTPAGTLQYTIQERSQPAVVAGDDPTGNNMPVEGTISINGITIDINEGDSQDDVWEKLVASTEFSGVTIERDDTPPHAMTFTSIRNGSKEFIKLDGNDKIWAELGIDLPVREIGSDIQISIPRLYAPNDGPPISEFNNSISVTTSGNQVSIRSAQGNEISLSISPPEEYRGATLNMPLSMQLRIEDFGGLRIQVGANHNQNMNIEIPRINSETLGFVEFQNGEKVNLLHYTTTEGATRAIEATDEAIKSLSRVRARLGAYQDRLEHTISNLDNASVNTELARSRVQDTDMAREMTIYTQHNVMFQAGLSILGQANQRPQMVLQLLQ